MVGGDRDPPKRTFESRRFRLLRVCNPQNGKAHRCRPDHWPVIFVLEFKVGEKEFTTAGLDQVCDYALDLKNFHETSYSCLIAPILIATNALPVVCTICPTPQNDKLLFPIRCSTHSLAQVIDGVLSSCFITSGAIQTPCYQCEIPRRSCALVPRSQGRCAFVVLPGGRGNRVSRARTGTRLGMRSVGRRFSPRSRRLGTLVLCWRSMEQHPKARAPNLPKKRVSCSPDAGEAGNGDCCPSG